MIFKLALRNLTKTGLRTIAIIVTIVLCSVMLFFGLIYSQIVKEEFYTTKVIEAENADIRIEYAPESDSSIVNTLPLAPYSEKIEFAAGVLDVYGRTNHTGEIDYINIRGMTEENINLINNFVYVEQRSGRLREDDIIITESTAEYFGLQLNKTINITIRDTEKRFIVGRIVKDHPSFEQSGAFVFYAKETYVSSIFPLGGFGKVYNKIFIKTVENTDINAFIKDLKEIEEYKGMKFSNEQSTSSSDRNAMDIAVPVIIALSAAACLALILVYMIISAGIRKRTELISQLKSVGANSSYIFNMFLVESVFYIVMGLALGIIINMVLLRNYVPKLMSINPENEYYKIRVLLSAAITAVAILALVMYPLLKTRNVSIRTAYVSSKNTIWKNNMVELCISIALILTGFFLILPHYLNFTRGLLSFVFIIAGGIILVPYILRVSASGLVKIFSKGALYNAAKNLQLERGIANNLRILFVGMVICSTIGGAAVLTSELAAKSVDSVDCDIIVSNVRSDTITQLNRIKATDGIYDAYAFQQKSANLKLKKGNQNITIIGIQPEDLDVMTDIGTITPRAELQRLLSEEEGMLIDYMFHKVFRVNIGDSIPVSIKGNTKNVKVTGFFDSMQYGGRTGLINNVYMKEVFNLPLYNTIVCKTTNDIDETVMFLRADLGTQNIIVLNKVAAYARYNNILQSTVDFGYYLSAFIMLVSFVGIFINILNSREERKISRYQMYSLGYSRLKLMGIEIFENIISGLLAVIAALGCLLLLNKSISNIMAISTVYIRKVILYDITMIIFAVFVAIYVVTALLSYFSIDKKKLIKTLKL